MFCSEVRKEEEEEKRRGENFIFLKVLVIHTRVCGISFVPKAAAVLGDTDLSQTAPSV